MPCPPSIKEPVSTTDFLPSEETTASAKPTAPSKEDEQAFAKANEAIAIRPKRGKLTLLSRRIYNVLLFHAQQQGVDQASYTILLSELISDARFNSNNTELLKSHIRDMQATTIEWHTSAGGRQSWLSTQLLGPVRIDEPGRGQPCSISWSFPEPIRDRLLRPTHYTRVLLEVSSQMRSYAGAVLYELGARYLTSPAKLSMREDVVWWASVLTGRSDIKTADYRILKRDTIRKALAEVDAVSTDFQMEVVEHHRGRKVQELQFRVVPKSQPESDASCAVEAQAFDLQLVERVVAIGIRRGDAEDLYARSDEAALRSAVEHVEQRMRNPVLAALQSPAAYLRDALKKHYPRAVAQPQAAGRLAASLAASTPEHGSRLRLEGRHRRTLEARRRFDAMEPAQQAGLVSRFEAEKLGELAPALASAWKREGLRSRIAGSAFFAWLAAACWPGDPTEQQPS